MADVKISALPAASALTGTELVPIVQGGVTVQSTPAAFVSNGTLAVSGTNLSYTGTLTGGTGVVNIGSGQLIKDASGNLGLGVTPSAWGSGYKAFQTPAGAIAANSTVSIAYAQNAFDSGSGAWKYLNTGAAGFYNQFLGQHAWYTAPSGTAGNAITFTQAMTLDASGNLLVGQTSSGGAVGVNANATQIGLGTTTISHVLGTISGAAYIYFGYNATTAGSITQDGTTAVLYNTTSDQRLKENIVDAPEASALIDAIQVRSFDWKSDGSHQRYGMVAQELHAVAPEAVHKPADPEEMMAVDYSKLVPMLVKEIQSLRARVAQLESN